MRGTKGVALAAVVALGAAGCGSSGHGTATSSTSAVAGSAISNTRSSSVGVTSSTLTIGLSAPFSGAYGPVITTLVDAGFDTWANQVNAEGGINGRKIILQKVDNKNTADGAIAACQQDKSNGTLMTVIVTGDPAEANCLNQAGVPSLTELTTENPPSSWTYARVVASASQLGQTLASFVKNVEHDGAKKLGVMYYTTEPQVKDVYESAAKALGMDVVDTEAIVPNSTSFVAQVQRLHNAGAGNVALFVGPEVIGILKSAKSLGYSPDFTGGLWASDTFSAAGGSAMNGIKGLYSAATSDSPGYATFLAAASKYGPKSVTRDQMGQYGIAEIVGEILKSAGANPTRATLESGIDTIKNYSDGMSPPVTWGPGVVVGSTSWFPEQCCNTQHQWTGLGDPQSKF